LANQIAAGAHLMESSAVVVNTAQRWRGSFCILLDTTAERENATMRMMDESESVNMDVNVIALQHAVLCADCEVISESIHDVCRVCGSSSLLSLSAVLGGTLPVQRAQLVDAPEPAPAAAAPIPLRRRMPHTRVRRAAA
jgi:hypothetical protein